MQLKLHIVTGDVSRDITAALTDTASSQLVNSFAPLRDGNSGSYLGDGTGVFREIKDTTKFRESFCQLYGGAELRNGGVVVKQGGRVKFTITDLKLSVQNASGDQVKSYYRAEYTLTVANDLLWFGTSTTLANQKQTVEYMNRF